MKSKYQLINYFFMLCGIFLAGCTTQPAQSEKSSPDLASELAISPIVITSTSKPVVSDIQISKIENWEIKSGESVRVALEKWCETAGYQLNWNLPPGRGYRAAGRFQSDDSFTTAILSLFESFPPELHLYVEITKNKLVIVTNGG